MLFNFLEILHFMLGFLWYCDTIDCIVAKTNEITAAFDLDSLTTENVVNSQQNLLRKQENYHTIANLNVTYFDDIDIPHTEYVDKARYGEGKELNVSGRVVHITSTDNPDNHEACTSNICGTRCQELPTDSNWIALIKRGDCKFERKIDNIYRLRHPAAGIIIYSDEERLVKMQVEGKDRNITAVIVVKSYGEHLVNLVEKYGRVWASITPGARIKDDRRSMTPTSVLFVTISFIILMLISVLWLVIYYFQRFRYLQTKDKQSKHFYNVAKRIIAKIPTKKVKAEDVDNEKDCCGICIESYIENDSVRVLPCNHEFHNICVDPWLLEHRTCPMCKMDILKHYGFPPRTQNSNSSTVIEDFMRGPIPNNRSTSDHNISRNNVADSMENNNITVNTTNNSTENSNRSNSNLNSSSNNLSNSNSTNIVSIENRQIIDV